MIFEYGKILNRYLEEVKKLQKKKITELINEMNKKPEVIPVIDFRNPNMLLILNNILPYPLQITKERFEKEIEPYHLLKNQPEMQYMIGKGVFGSIFDIGDGKVVKEIIFDKMGQIFMVNSILLWIKNVKKEYEMLSKVENTPKTYELSFFYDEMNQNVIAYLVMEKIEGRLLSQIPPPQQKQIMPEIDRIISKMHNKGIIHMDLHQDNIIIDKNNKIYFIDFGKSSYEIPNTNLKKIKQHNRMRARGYLSNPIAELALREVLKDIKL